MKPILTYPLLTGQYIKSIDSAAFSITKEEAEKVKMNALFNFKPGLPNYYMFDKEESVKLSDIKVYITD